MSATLISPLPPKPAPAASGASWKLIPSFETMPTCVRLAQTVPGKVAMLAIFAGIYRLHSESWLAMSTLILAVTFQPGYRRVLVACGTLYWLLFHSSWCDWNMVRKVAEREGAAVNFAWLIPIATAAFLVFAGGFCWAVSRWRTVRALRGLFFCWGCVTPFCCWGLVTRQSRRRARLPVDRRPAAGELFLVYWLYPPRPEFQGPRPASAADGGLVSFLDRRRDLAHSLSQRRRVSSPNGARTPADFAVTQIKGLKLLLWTALLGLTLTVFRNLAHVWLHIPFFPETLAHSVARQSSHISRAVSHPLA